MPEKLPVHDSVYEQESMLEFRGRAERMLSKIMAEAIPNEIIAVVTHGGMINQLYRAFFRLPVDSDYRFQTGDTGYHEWVIDKDMRAVIYANREEQMRFLDNWLTNLL